MAHHPLIGYLVWALLFGALFAWEGLALSHLSNYVPTLSDTFRAIMRYPVRPVGAVRAVAVVRLAYFRPWLALPAPGLTCHPTCSAPTSTRWSAAT